VTGPGPAEIAYRPGVYYAFKDINQANIRLGHLSLNDRSPDRYAFKVLNYALGNSFTSRITKQVRTTAGLAYSAGSWLSQGRWGGAFFAYCQTEAGHTVAAVRMIRNIIAEVQRDGITVEEMNLAKEAIINSFVFKATTPQQIVNARAGLEVDGFPPDQLQQDLAGYRAVTIEDCLRVAARYLHPEEMVILIVGNRETFDESLDALGPVTEIPLDTP
jgi:predicted Zn-dependent peptidase